MFDDGAGYERFVSAGLRLWCATGDPFPFRLSLAWFGTRAFREMHTYRYPPAIRGRGTPDEDLDITLPNNATACIIHNHVAVLGDESYLSPAFLVSVSLDLNSGWDTGVYPAPSDDSPREVHYCEGDLLGWTPSGQSTLGGAPLDLASERAEAQNPDKSSDVPPRIRFVPRPKAEDETQASLGLSAPDARLLRAPTLCGGFPLESLFAALALAAPGDDPNEVEFSLDTSSTDSVWREIEELVHVDPASLIEKSAAIQTALASAAKNFTAWHTHDFEQSEERDQVMNRVVDAVLNARKEVATLRTGSPRPSIDPAAESLASGDMHEVMKACMATGYFDDSGDDDEDPVWMARRSHEHGAPFESVSEPHD